jgi:uncharacterized protein YabN with tetrapyrrole methylase and pyrophosphatase domain
MPAARRTRRTPRTSAGSLTIVGTGVTMAAHITAEALAYITQAEKVLYLVTEPAMGIWLRDLNATAQTLDDLYAEGKPRHQTYREMTARILDHVRQGLGVVVVAYGHPGVFVESTHAALAEARALGYPARMLPAVSSQDCLLADLGINPGDHGCQFFEATDFLASRRRFDPTSHLLLYQVAVLGVRSVQARPSVLRPRLQALTNVLSRAYPSTHRVTLYQAATLPACQPIVRRITLAKLPATRIPPMATLYVPPLEQRRRDRRIWRWFDEA